MRPTTAALYALLLIAPAGASADPRQKLAAAGFTARDKAAALQGVNEALAETRVILARDPANKEAALQRAIATGYHAQLTRSLGEAKDTRRQFERLVAAYPGDPEPLLALASWHLTAVTQLGGFVAGTVLGASKAEGLRDLDRAVAAGRGRALFPAYAAMLRIQIDPGKVQPARQLAQAAIQSPAPTAIDRMLQERAVRLMVPLNTGNGEDAAALAKRLMPLAQAG